MSYIARPISINGYAPISSHSHCLTAMLSRRCSHGRALAAVSQGRALTHKTLRDTSCTAVECKVYVYMSSNLFLLTICRFRLFLSEISRENTNVLSRTYSRERALANMFVIRISNEHVSQRRLVQTI